MQRNGRKAVKLEKRESKRKLLKENGGEWKQRCGSGTTKQTDSILQKKTLRIGSVSNYRHYTMESLILAQDER